MNFLFKNFLILILASSLVSCGIFSDKKEIRKISVSIIANHPLSPDANARMPELIRKVLMPIECEQITYIPRVEVERLDLPNEPEYVVQVPMSISHKLRKKFGIYSYNQLTNDYQHYVPNLKAGEYLSMNGVALTEQDSFYYSDDDMVFFIPPKQLNRLRINRVISEIKNSLSADEPGQNTEFFIVLSHKNEQRQEQGMAMNIQQETLISRNIPDEGRRKSELQKIYDKYRKDETKSLDYWAYYELAINRIVGEDHHESFACLKKAAEMAIHEGDGEILLGRILDDAEKDQNISDIKQRGAWRLITHPNQWNPIKAALKRNDESLLNEGRTHEEHHH